MAANARAQKTIAAVVRVFTFRQGSLAVGEIGGFDNPGAENTYRSPRTKPPRAGLKKSKLR
jgi:hypothetical protein